MNVLFVCDGNLCRSPIAELTFTARLPADPPVHATSAGLRAPEGEPMHQRSAELLGRKGIDANTFRASRITTARLAAADVVITMTRAQREEVLRLEPAALPGTVTLPELARAARDSAPTRRATVDGLAELVRTAILGRRALPDPADDDIADPMGTTPSTHRGLLDRVSSDVDAVLAHLTDGSRPTESACPPAAPR